MIDIKLLRMELASAHENLAKRGYKLDMILFNTLEEQRKRNQIDLEQCKGEKKLLSQQFGREASQGNDTIPLKVKIEALDARMNKIDEVLSTVQVELADLMSGIPNLIHTSVPTGKTESDNVLIREWGTPKAMDHPKDHIELGERMGGMDIDTAAKLSGARFSLLKNDIAKLHRALIQFMLDLHTDEHGYEEVYCPYLVQGRPLYGTGQLPKFSEDLYKIEGHDLYLIPTGEVPLTNIVSDRVLEEAELPLKLVVHTPCFRSEAGSYGRDTRGLIRQHQFDKVELVQIVHPERSYEALEELTGHAEIVLKKLDLPYRVVNLCSADIGFSAAKTYDLEVWLPSQNTYREISSCSNCEAFQARRMSARYKDLKTQKNHLIHTLNGSALAVGRTLIAVMENYQNPNGSIAIPVVLRPYMNDREQIG